MAPGARRRLPFHSSRVTTDRSSWPLLRHRVAPMSNPYSGEGVFQLPGGGGNQPQDPEHDPGQVPLEAAKRLAAALALGLLAGEERARRSVHAPRGDRDPMQGAVE